MNIFLIIFFLIIGILGLIYRVDAGVFIGFSLLPWQVIRLKYREELNIVVIVISSLIGGIYFFHFRGSWKLLGLFLLIELYNYWGHKHL